jgi:hypothetical protein
MHTGENNHGLLSSSVIARTTACASNANSSFVDDSENSGRFSPVYFLIMPSDHPGGEDNNNKDALVALPSDVVDTHRSYNGLPVSVKFVWRKNFHERAPRRSPHEHRIREVVAMNAQHDLSNKAKRNHQFSLYIRGEKGGNGAGEILGSPSTERAHSYVPSNSRFRLRRIL